MKILIGKQVNNVKEATNLACQEAGLEVISADIIDMFTSLSAIENINSEADKTINIAVKSRYGSKATWRAERWYVPLPKLQYVGKDIPQLLIEVRVYLVAAAVLRMTEDSRVITLVGSVGKSETLTIPMIFLHALLEKDLGRFIILTRDSVYTTWEVPGAKTVRLPGNLVSELTTILKYKSVVAWLGQFGAQGRCVAPLVAGSLLGLAFQDSSQPTPVSKEVVTTDNLVSALESMAYQPAEAKEMVKRIASRLRAGMTLEEAIRITLQMGKGGE